MNANTVFQYTLLAISISLTACGGGGGSSSGSDEELVENPSSDENPTDNQNDANDDTNDEANDQSSDNSDSPVILSDTTWNAGVDLFIGIGFDGNSETPEITMMKAAPVSAQDGDVFSIRSVTYPDTEFTEIKNIDNGMDRRDFQDMDILSHNDESYVVACQDGSDTTGFTSAVSLHIFKATDTSKVVEFDLIDGNIEARECSGISAEFTQGASDSMEAVIYYAGDTMTTSGSPLYRYPRIMKVEFTIDTTIDVDATDAVVMDSISTVVRGDINDSMSGVVGFGDHVYYAYYDDSEGTNNLGYANSSSSPAITRNVDWSANDPFVPSVAQQMLVKDMFVIPGTSSTDFDYIYIVSDFDTSGIVVAGYRRDMNLKQAMKLSDDTATENCSDVLTGVSDQGPGNRLWCHDATDNGKVNELSSPVYPAEG